MTRTCAHDPMTAQRQCACDPACVCRIAGNCPAMSGDTIPPRIEEAFVYGAEGPPKLVKFSEPNTPRTCGVLHIPLPLQCQAILPNDRRLEVNDGWKHCSLAQGHTEPHRTAYTGSGTCAGDPAWTFDRAGIEALPSSYYTPPTVQLGENVAKLAGSAGAEVVVYGVGIELKRAGEPTVSAGGDDPTLVPLSSLIGPPVEQAITLERPREAFVAGQGQTIEVVPPERLRAELATWQDEWPGVEQLGDQDTPKP